MTKAGFVTIVTATYNMAEYLPETLDSILAQDYPHIESIVVDDGSTDNTQEVLEAYSRDPRIKVVRQPNSGQTVAKNRGIAEATGEFVAFCDADDVWRKDKLSKQIPAFADSGVAVVFSDIHCINGSGQTIDDYDHMQRTGGRITAELMVDNFVPFPTTVVRAKVLEEFGGFDESLSMSIDYDLWLRISTKYSFAYIREPLASYRIWEGQMSHRVGERLENFFRLLDRFIADNPGIVTQKEIDRAWAHVHATRGWWHYMQGRRGDAVGDFGHAMKLHFFDRRLWWMIAAMLLGRK